MSRPLPIQMDLPMTIQAKAPAKLNLWLKVLGRREDGYHLLNMLNATLSLSDDLLIEITEEPRFEISVKGERAKELSDASSNLALRAAKDFMRNFGLPYGAKITLEKNIPLGAGLGGGSSDAAAVLRALRSALASQIKERDIDHELSQIALRLGADVPFLLLSRLALVSGVGEEVRPLDLNFCRLLHKLPVTIVYPRINLPTKDVYERLRQTAQLESVLDRYGSSILETHDLEQLLRVLGEFMHNDLEKAASSISPELSLILSRLRQAFPEHRFILCGSGSSMFCASPSVPSSRLVQSALPGQSVEAFDAYLDLI